MTSAPGARTAIDNVEYDYYGGTGYLGLQGHEEVRNAAAQAVLLYGVHSATSRDRFASPPVLEAERAAAEFFQTETAWYIPTGYAGSAILIAALNGSVDRIFLDDASHYSVVEAAWSSGLPVHPFASRDPRALQAELGKVMRRGERPVVMTDGVFPSFGWVAPLADYATVLQPYEHATLLVDDCHGYGVLGANGRGTVEAAGMFDQANTMQVDAPLRVFCIGTLSKALGGYGGILPCDAEFRAVATEKSHYHGGASAPPAMVAAASACALRIAHAEPERRDALLKNIQAVRDGLRRLGIDTPDVATPIVGFTLGSSTEMLDLHAALRDRGIMVPYLRAYSGIGPSGSLRLAVFATHTEQMIERLLEELAQLV